MYRWWVWLRDRKNKVWVTPAVGVVAASLLALGAASLNRVVPDGSLPEIDAETLQNLLGMVSSSMLSVATFSLGIMVSAFGSASTGATPRSLELVMGDDATRTAIGSFLAAFIYAVVARTALGLSYYGSTGRFVLFVSTLLVLAYLVVTLIVWVKALSTLGRLGDTLSRIDDAASAALAHHARAPWLHARPGPAEQPAGVAVRAKATGYVSHLDLDGLQAVAERIGAQLHLRVRPGAYVHPGTVLVVVQQGAAAGKPGDRLAGTLALSEGDDEADEAHRQALREAFVVARSRTYDQDPRFGLIVLSEVAQRALSPAVNDPGTAIEVMGVLTRLLVNWSRHRTDAVQAVAQARIAASTSAHKGTAGAGAAPVLPDRPGRQAGPGEGHLAQSAASSVPPVDGRDCHDEAALKFPDLTVLPLDAADFLADGFEAIARDGAGSVEVGLRLQKHLAMLREHVPEAMRPALLALARRSLRRALPALTLQDDRERLTATHERLHGPMPEATASA